MDAYVEGIALHHIVAESTVVSTVEKFLLGYLSSGAMLTGLREGLGRVGRDVDRHVDFAIESLRAAVGGNVALAGAVRGYVEAARAAVRDALDAPLTGGGLPYGSEDTSAWAFDSLEKRLRAIGADARP